MKLNKFARLVARSMRESRAQNTLYVVSGRGYQDWNKWWCEPNRHCKKTLAGILREATRNYCMKEREVRIYEIDLSKLKPIYEGRVPK